MRGVAEGLLEWVHPEEGRSPRARGSPHLSAETAIKQRTAHPELAAAEYTQAQAVIDHGTGMAQDGKNMIYVREMDAADTGGYVLVVKATQTGEGLWVTSYRRLSRKDAARDSEVRSLLRKDGR